MVKAPFWIQKKLLRMMSARKNMRKTKEATEKESSNREVNKNSIDASEDSTAL